MTFSAPRRGLARTLVALLALFLAGAGSATGSVHAQAASTGADYCTTGEGVTVVVDMTVFDEGIIVRCVEGPLPSGYTGWDALTDAGFSPQAPARQPGFLCRIAGEPSADRSLSIPGDDDYHEQCVVTPPESAYWGYWHAPNGGDWTYSLSGVASHQVIEGGFEGFSFSLNGVRPPPGIAPVRPRAAPSSPTPSPAPTTPPQPTPSTVTPTPPVAPTSTATPTSPVAPTSTSVHPTATPTPGAGPQPTQRPAPSPTSTASPPRPPASSSTRLSPAPLATSRQPTSTASFWRSTEPVAEPGDAAGEGGDGGDKNGAAASSGKPDGKQDRGRGRVGNPPTPTGDVTGSAESDGGAVVTGEIPAAADDGQSGGSPQTLLIGLGLLAVLAFGAGLTAWRRTRA